MRLWYPHLADTIALQQALLEAGNRLQITVPESPVRPEIAQERLRAGKPLLYEDDFDVDREQLVAFEQEARNIIADHRPDLAPILAQPETFILSADRLVRSA